MAHFDDTSGAVLVSLMLSMTMYGITIVQAYTYYITYRDDRWSVKYLVLLIFILDTLGKVEISESDTIFTSHASYRLLVTFYGEPGNLMAAVENTWLPFSQHFLGHRVWKLTGNNWPLSGFIVRMPLTVNVTTDCSKAVLALVQFGTLGLLFITQSSYLPIYVQSLRLTHSQWIVVVATMCFLEHNLFTKLNKMTWVLLVPYSCAAACDTTITVSLCWYLYLTPTYFERYDSFLQSIMTWFYLSMDDVITSIFNSAFALLTLDARNSTEPLIWPSNLVYIGVFFLLSKLYTNSLLGILNTRKNLRNTMLSTFEVAELGNSIPMPRFSAPHHDPDISAIHQPDHSEVRFMLLLTMKAPRVDVHHSAEKAMIRFYFCHVENVSCYIAVGEGTPLRNARSLYAQFGLREEGTRELNYNMF
ncbi:hypothetical protein K439DRAFT_1617237 [Ramaria rubella]|nr:hypothetical protein K439DRAFT_1618404 [Ramaria rubella]KAF8583794.1 hypothetical protein K439DRAFT_1617237 [Ramaria rubella]